MHIDMTTHVSPHVTHTLRRTDSSCTLIRPAFNLNSKPQIFVQPSSGWVNMTSSSLLHLDAWQGFSPGSCSEYQLQSVWHKVHLWGGVLFCHLRVTPARRTVKPQTEESLTREKQAHRSVNSTFPSESQSCWCWSAVLLSSETDVSSCVSLHALFSFYIGLHVFSGDTRPQLWTAMRHSCYPEEWLQDTWHAVQLHAVKGLSLKLLQMPAFSLKSWFYRSKLHHLDISYSFGLSV